MQVKLIIQNSKHRTFVLLYDIKMNIFHICLENPLTNPCTLRPKITRKKYMFVVFFISVHFGKSIYCQHQLQLMLMLFKHKQRKSIIFFLFWNLRESWDIVVVVWKVPFYCAIKIKILFVGWKCGTFTGESQQNTTANINNHLIETMLRFIENCVDELLQNFPHSFNIGSWKFFLFDAYLPFGKELYDFIGSSFMWIFQKH